VKNHYRVFPIAVLALTIGASSLATAQDAEPRNRGARRGNQERVRDDDYARPRADRPGRDERDRSQAGRGEERREAEGSRERAGQAERAERSDRRERADGRREAQVRERERGDRYTRDAYRGSREAGRDRGAEAARRDVDRSPDRRDTYRNGYSRGYSSGYSRGYYAPRRIDRRYPSKRYYGPGGHLSLYFGIGSGYRHGSPYYGRVYGYRRSAPTYGRYVLYGDLRLKVSPRDAAVYVDGYYAGIVDDFDGFFQRLTLEAGPHEIEIDAPGLGSQVFDVYVDPERTIDLHADLRR
jgi:hypothetical protein